MAISAGLRTLLGKWTTTASKLAQAGQIEQVHDLLGFGTFPIDELIACWNEQIDGHIKNGAKVRSSDPALRNITQLEALRKKAWHSLVPVRNRLPSHFRGMLWYCNLSKDGEDFQQAMFGEVERISLASWASQLGYFVTAIRTDGHVVTQPLRSLSFITLDEMDRLTTGANFAVAEKWVCTTDEPTDVRERVLAALRARHKDYRPPH